MADPGHQIQPKVFLKSKRSCRINLAQELLEINEETELQEFGLQEILEGKKAAEINSELSPINSKKNQISALMIR